MCFIFHGNRLRDLNVTVVLIHKIRTSFTSTYCPDQYGGLIDVLQQRTKALNAASLDIYEYGNGKTPK